MAKQWGKMAHLRLCTCILDEHVHFIVTSKRRQRREKVQNTVHVSEINRNFFWVFSVNRIIKGGAYRQCSFYKFSTWGQFTTRAQLIAVVHWHSDLARTKRVWHHACCDRAITISTTRWHRWCLRFNLRAPMSVPVFEAHSLLSDVRWLKMLVLLNIMFSLIYEWTMWYQIFTVCIET